MKPCFSSGNGSQLAANTQKTDSALVAEIRFAKQALTYQGLNGLNVFEPQGGRLRHLAQNSSVFELPDAKGEIRLID